MCTFFADILWTNIVTRFWSRSRMWGGRGEIGHVYAWAIAVDMRPFFNVRPWTARDLSWCFMYGRWASGFVWFQRPYWLPDTWNIFASAISSFLSCDWRNGSRVVCFSKLVTAIGALGIDRRFTTLLCNYCHSPWVLHSLSFVTLICGVSNWRYNPPVCLLCTACCIFSSVKNWAHGGLYAFFRQGQEGWRLYFTRTLTNTLGVSEVWKLPL